MTCPLANSDCSDEFPSCQLLVVKSNIPGRAPCVGTVRQVRYRFRVVISAAPPESGTLLT